MLALAALVGCGGGGHDSSPANDAALRMSVAWPAHTYRAVPNAANSIVASVTVKGKEVAHALFVRAYANNRGLGDDSSSSSIDFKSLPAGEAKVTYTAYPTNDGTGTAQAAGVSTKTLVGGKTVEETATMDSTVASLEFVDKSAMRLKKGYYLDLDDRELTAHDAKGSVVIIEYAHWREELTWKSSDEALAKIEPYEQVSGQGEGTPTITASMVGEGGKSVTASLPVTVVALKSLAITPGSKSTTSRIDIPLTATGTWSDGVTEDLTSSVTWQSGSSASVGASGNLHWINTMVYSTATVTATYGALSDSATYSVV